MHLAAEFLAAQIALQRAQIIAHARAHEGVQHRRGRALVFAELAQDFVAQRHEEIGLRAAQDLAHQPLMGGVRVRMQETDGDRLHAMGGELAGHALHLSGVDGRQNVARRVHALAHFEGELAIHEGLGPMEPEIERIDAIAAADGVDVAEAARGDQRRLRALALQHRIDGDGGPMQHVAEFRQVAMGQRQRVGDAACGIGRRGGGFGSDDLSVDAAHEISERAADVYAYDIHSFTDALRACVRRLPGVRLCSAMRTSSLKAMAMAARQPISAKSGAGL